MVPDGYEIMVRWYNPYSLPEKDKKIESGYIYLRYFNVVDGKLLGIGFNVYDIAENQDKFVGKSKIYNNGGSEIYK
jgi:uncharacterized membrane protein